MQNEVTEAIDLLKNDGTISTEGWARHPLWVYDRSRIRSNGFRIKEWDYYAVLAPDEGFGITLTFSDLGYAGLYALCWVDLIRGCTVQADRIVPLTRHRTGLCASPDKCLVGTAHADLTLAIACESGKRHLDFAAPELAMPDGSKGLEGTIELQQPDGLESLNIATSWAENRRAFYYNRKLNCMPATGNGRAGGRNWELNPGRHAACLDWGRGRWVYQSTWYWASLSSHIEGVPFGFNLGYGFTDRTPASENALVFDGKIHKLGEVKFEFNTTDYLQNWKISDDENRLKLVMAPIVDRNSDFNLGIIASRQHRVFGRFSGKALLDDGRTLHLDDLTGFAEEVSNRW